MKGLFITATMRLLTCFALVLIIAASPLSAETYKKKVDHKGRAPKQATKVNGVFDGR
jgi:hypothetical protein